MLISVHSFVRLFDESLSRALNLHLKAVWVSSRSVPGQSQVRLRSVSGQSQVSLRSGSGPSELTSSRRSLKYFVLLCLLLPDCDWYKNVPRADSLYYKKSNVGLAALETLLFLGLTA